MMKEINLNLNNNFYCSNTLQINKLADSGLLLELPLEFFLFSFGFELNKRFTIKNNRIFNRKEITITQNEEES